MSKKTCCLSLLVLATTLTAQWVTAAEPPKTITNSIGMKLVLIPAGEFMMGSPESETDRLSDERPLHRVQISKPFYLGVYEVMQAEYRRI